MNTFLPRSYHVCGRADKYMVAAGGNYHPPPKTDVLNLETMTWSLAPYLPGSVHSTEQVQLEDTFLVVGGFDSNLMQSVFEFDPRTLSWMKREERLKFPRKYHSVIQIPRDLLIGK